MGGHVDPNLKTGNPFIVEDTAGGPCMHGVPSPITVEYQSILNAINSMQNAMDRNQIYTKYMELHVSIGTA